MKGDRDHIAPPVYNLGDQDCWPDSTEDDSLICTFDDYEYDDVMGVVKAMADYEALTKGSDQEDQDEGLEEVDLCTWLLDDTHDMSVMDTRSLLGTTLTDLQPSFTQDQYQQQPSPEQVISSVSFDHCYSMSVETPSSAEMTSSSSSSSDTTQFLVDASTSTSAHSPSSLQASDSQHFSTEQAFSSGAVTAMGSCSRSPSGSLSGYSSATESLASSEDSAVSLLSRPTQSAHSLLNDQVKSLIMQKALTDSKKNGDATFTCSVPSSAASSSSPRLKQKRARTRASSAAVNKKWSQMDEEEQMDSITELTNIISAQLGVRERLEAIRIISPNSTVSPTDGEFVLDMSLINNTRFAKLRRFVRHHVEDYGRRSSTTQQSSREPPQLSSLSLDVSDQLVACTQRKPGRRRRSQGNRREKKALCQRLAKEQQQAMERVRRQREKEIQSGLFSQEIRVSVQYQASDRDDEDDENVDIMD